MEEYEYAVHRDAPPRLSSMAGLTEIFRDGRPTGEYWGQLGERMDMLEEYQKLGGAYTFKLMKRRAPGPAEDFELSFAVGDRVEEISEDTDDIQYGQVVRLKPHENTLLYVVKLENGTSAGKRIFYYADEIRRVEE